MNAMDDVKPVTHEGPCDEDAGNSYSDKEGQEGSDSSDDSAYRRRTKKSHRRRSGGESKTTTPKRRRSSGGGFAAPLQLSPKLAELLGYSVLPRTEGLCWLLWSDHGIAQCALTGYQW